MNYDGDPIGSGVLRARGPDEAVASLPRCVTAGRRSYQETSGRRAVTMPLRHHRGALNVVPYGAIRRMTNESRGWVVEKLEFRSACFRSLSTAARSNRCADELKGRPPAPCSPTTRPP